MKKKRFPLVLFVLVMMVLLAPSAYADTDEGVSYLKITSFMDGSSIDDIFTSSLDFFDSPLLAVPDGVVLNCYTAVKVQEMKMTQAYIVSGILGGSLILFGLIMRTGKKPKNSNLRANLE